MNSKAKEQSKITADSSIFLANGGTIEQLPYDPSAENADQIGRWQLMGDEVHDDITPRKYGERFEYTFLDDEEDGFNFNADPATFAAMADAEDYFSVDERQDW